MTENGAKAGHTDPPLTDAQGARLAMAAELVRGVAAEMDASKAPCPCCGLQRAGNWSQMQAAVQLEALARKLDGLRRWKGRPGGA